jgi:hypothetical protein
MMKLQASSLDLHNFLIVFFSLSLSITPLPLTILLDTEGRLPEKITFKSK